MDYASYYAESSGSSTLSIISSLIGCVLAVIAMWRIFVKAGQPGWAALIPFYNMYVLFKITWGNGWKFLLLLIPIANIVFGIMAVWKLGTAFGKGTGFKFGLLFLGTIFMLILGFDDSVYLGVGGYGAQAYQQPYQPQQQAYTPQQPAGKFCTSCGSQLDDNATFCPNCGARQ